MNDAIGPWQAPINQKAELHDWNLDLNSLRLNVLKPGFLHPDTQAETVLALVDDWGRIYPRERALIVIERLLVFYNSVTDEQLDVFNSEIEGEEGGKLAAVMKLERTLLNNRKGARERVMAQGSSK